MKHIDDNMLVLNMEKFVFPTLKIISALLMFLFKKFLSEYFLLLKKKKNRSWETILLYRGTLGLSWNEFIDAI